NGKSNC
ncbi:Shikimate kinase 1, partial [Haemophilus influenzae]